MPKIKDPGRSDIFKAQTIHTVLDSILPELGCDGERSTNPDPLPQRWDNSMVRSVLLGTHPHRVQAKFGFYLRQQPTVLERDTRVGSDLGWHRGPILAGSRGTGTPHHGVTAKARVHCSGTRAEGMHHGGVCLAFERSGGK